MKRLISIQGVLTVLGLVTGIAAIILPFGIVFAYPKVDELGILRSLAELADYFGPRYFDVDMFLLVLAFAPLLLAVPISVGYLRWLVTGGLAPWAWRTAYAVAALVGAWVLFIIGWGVFSGWFELSEIRNAAATLYALVSLGVGVWLVMRNRRLSIPHTRNALIALQAVYVVNTVMLLVIFIPQRGFPVAMGWNIGALPALLTVVVYVVQMVLGSRRKGGTETLGTPRH
jgi:hypothetical protein